MQTVPKIDALAGEFFVGHIATESQYKIHRVILDHR